MFIKPGARSADGTSQSGSEGRAEHTHSVNDVNAGLSLRDFQNFWANKDLLLLLDVLDNRWKSPFQLAMLTLHTDVKNPNIIHRLDKSIKIYIYIPIFPNDKKIL